jgi:hypothetical protein
MAAAGAVMAVAGTMLQMGAARQEKKARENADRERRDNALWYGGEQKKKAEFEAIQLEEQAGKAVAVGQRENMEIQRHAKLTESRALALAAASGGGASSPTVVNIIGNIAKRGAYEGAVALYNGEERARTLRLAAASKRLEGDIAFEAGTKGDRERVDSGNLAIGAGLLQNTGSLLMKYGGGGQANTPMVEESVPGQFSTTDPAYG